jgi:hypothetical protein
LRLPPIERRPNIKNSLVGKYLFKRFDEKKDDLFIYYLAYKATLNACIFVSLIFVGVYLTDTEIDFTLFNISSHTAVNLDLGLFKIYGSKEKQVENLLAQFSNVMMVISLTILFPFYLLKFLWSINPKHYDVLHFNDNYRDPKSRNRSSLIQSSIFGIGMFLVMMMFGHYSTKAPPLSMFYSESLFSLVLYMMLGAFVYVISVNGILIAVVSLIRYIGPYKGL